MGLISKEVEITWQRKTCLYYKNLGYIFTKIGDVFKVKVEDLLKNSKVLVYVKCDGENCVNPHLKPMSWANYNKYVKDNGVYLCNKCSKRLTGNKKQSKTLLIKHGKSFEQWCIENNHQDVLDRWDYELNDCKPSEICYSSRKKFYFKCPKGNHNSELSNIGDFTNGHNGVMNCKQCNSFAQWGIDNICEDFLDKYWDFHLNIINPWKVSYGSRSKDIWIKCQEKDYHGSYKTNCNNFIYGNRCPYCENQKGLVHPLDSLGTLYPQVLEIWSDKNDKSAFKYSPYSTQYIWFKCLEEKHQDSYRCISNAQLNNFCCPECSRERNESYLQEKVRLYFKKLQYNLFHEYNCNLKCYNPKTNHLLPYDNEIVELQLICEVHGIQHYSITNFHNLSAKKFNTTPQYELEYIQYKDKIKKDFVLSQGYYYLEIPYWTDDKKETWKKLINDKIHHILNINIINNLGEREVS